MPIGAGTLGTLGALSEPSGGVEPPEGPAAACTPALAEWVTAAGDAHPFTDEFGACAGRPYGLFMPPTVRREQARPEGPGTVIIGLGHGSRLVRLPVGFTANGQADLLALLRQWAQWLNVLDGEGWLRYTPEGGSARRLRCAYHAGLELEESRGSEQLGVMLTDLEFIAADPYWTDDGDIELLIGVGDRPAFLPIPNQTTGSFVTITSGSAWDQTEVTNDGDLPAFPTWTVDGPAEGVVRFTEQDSGEFIELVDVVVPEGDTLVVDVEAGTVVVAGANGWPLVTDPSRMWLLPVGVSEVGVDVEGSGPTTAVSLRYTRRWLTR